MVVFKFGLIVESRDAKKEPGTNYRNNEDQSPANSRADTMNTVQREA